MTTAKALKIVLLSTLVIVLDQVSKDMVLENLSRGEIVPVIDGLFNLTLTYNPGIAFGLFADMDPRVRGILLSITIGLALCVVCFLLFREYRDDSLAHLALGLIIGGAIGNIIDRVRFGSVVDFLDFYIGSYHWPAFNVADSAICVAVAFLLLRQFAGQSAASPANDPASE